MVNIRWYIILTPERCRKYDTYEIPVAEIFLDREFNCRLEIPLNTVSELAQSIRETRLECPIVVQPANEVSSPLPEGKEWRIIAGHRRFVACTRILKWETIPALVRYGISEQEAGQLNLAENLDRRELNILEEAKALRRVFPDEPDTVVAAKMGKGVRWVMARRELLTLKRGVQKAALAGIVTAHDILLYIKEGRPWNFFDTLQSRKELDLTKPKDERIFVVNTSWGTRIRRKTEIQDMIVEILTSEFQPTAARALAWAIQSVTTREIRKDLAGN